MRKLIHYISCFVLATLFIASCKKEGRQYFIEEGQFAGNALSSTSANVVLLSANENNTAVTFNWAKANFGEKPVIKYTLQLDVPSDTSGVNGWANAKNFDAGTNSDDYSFLVKDINNTLNAMALAAGVSHDIVVRVKAEVPQYNGSASSITPIYTNAILVKMTPYSLSLYIPGEYQGWSPATAPELNPVEGRPGMYEGYVYMPGTGTKYFKYTSARDWDHINYGDGGNGTFSTDGLAGGLSVPDGGYYEVTANLNNNTWTATKTTWSIVGDATPGGWNTDTQMTYDAVSQVWKVTCDMLSTGSFKFRANNAWTIDFGIDPATSELVYADNPFLGYTAGLWNLAVPTSGNYTITLDLHVSQQYTYILHKN